MKILLCDLSALFWTSWFASEGQALSAARELTLRKVRAHRERFDRIVLCLDSPRSVRKEIAPTYKANREAKPLDALDQMRRTLDTLKGDGYVAITADGWEGDDVIASATKALTAAAHDVTILGCDKDLFQLLHSGVTMINSSTGERLDGDSVFDKTGVFPHHIPCWLALVGDTSDNIQGIRGIGPKKAAALIDAHGTVDGILQAALDPRSEFNDRQRKTLEEHETSLRQARELCRLRDDLPIDVDAILAEPVVSSVVEQETEPFPDSTPGGTVSNDPFETPVDSVLQDALDKRSKANSSTTVPPPAPAPKPPDSAPSEAITNAPVIDAEFVSTERASSPGNGASKALVKTGQTFELEFEPRNMKQAIWLAQAVTKSRMFSAYGNPEAVLMVLMAGRELGLGAMASLRAFHVNEGKPTMSAQLMMALCRRRKDICKEFRVIKMTNEIAVVRTWRADSQEPTPDWEFSWKDAERAGLATRATYQKYPRNMLLNRCIANAARFDFPEICANLYDPDELTDEEAA